jgi:hypothetical protein
MNTRRLSLAWTLAGAFLLAQQTPPPASATEAMYRAAAESAGRKFTHLQENARKPQPDQQPTVFTEQEINAYLSSGNVKLPVGVRNVRLTGTPGEVQARAEVDFDAITAGRNKGNPLLSLFHGTHLVEANGHAAGQNGQGQVHVDSAAIDGMSVPRIALEYFVDHYVKPRHPEAGMDSTFKLPARVDTAVVGEHTLTVTQK